MNLPIKVNFSFDFWSVFEKWNYYKFVCFEFEDTTKNEEEINQDIVKKVREMIGPIAAIKCAAAVKGLPRTRSGKTCRQSIANLARSKAVKVNFSSNL